MKTIKQVSMGGALLKRLNDNLIALIPKVIAPETINQFRAVNLCNTSYKVITRTIVKRLRHMVDKFITPFQSGFIPGRKAVDNVVILREATTKLNSRMGQKGLMSIKLDLEKVNDHMEWDFVNHVLEFFEFPNARGGA